MVAAEKVVFIVGPTASGKSSLAMRVAQSFRGEIICADSQTVRRGLDIGTAKPTSEEQAQIPHHMLDLIDPYDTYSAAEFKRLAEEKIKKIKERGNLPIVVGGTGLYVDALLYDFSFIGSVDENLRKDLDKKSIEELQKMLADKGISIPENARNRRHLVRRLESAGLVPTKKAIRSDAIVIGLDPGKEVLEDKIRKRIIQMLNEGFLNEVDSIVRKYGPPPRSFDAIGYKIAFGHRLKTGLYDEKAIIREFSIADRQYAKRQRTWFKRNADIAWFEQAGEALKFLEKQFA